MGNTQFNHAVLERVAKSLMRSCGVRTRITCVFHRVNFKWAQCASPQPAPSHLEFALTLPAIRITQRNHRAWRARAEMAWSVLAGKPNSYARWRNRATMSLAVASSLAIQRAAGNLFPLSCRCSRSQSPSRQVAGDRHVITPDRPPFLESRLLASRPVADAMG